MECMVICGGMPAKKCRVSGVTGDCRSAEEAKAREVALLKEGMERRAGGCRAWSRGVCTCSI